jgi:hypothetical protein
VQSELRPRIRVFVGVNGKFKPGWAGGGDGEEAFYADRKHPDVMTDQLGVGMGVALRARHATLLMAS